MDRFRIFQNLIERKNNGFVSYSKKYKQIADMKSVTQIVSDVLRAFKDASVRIDSSNAAARWLARYAGNSPGPLCSGRVDGVPVLIGGTASYMVSGFCFCVVKKNGKPRAIVVRPRTIDKLYKDDLSSIDPQRVSEHVKRILKYSDDISHGNDMDDDDHVAIECMFGWGKKTQPKDTDQASSAIIQALNERYGKQMLELAKEIANDFERRMRSNKAFADSYEININDKTSSDCIINKRGIVNVVVIHWQEIVDTMAEMSNTDLYDSDADDHSGDIFADRYAKEVNLDYYVRKYTSKAKAIHPSCEVKKIEDDIDMICLRIDPSAVNA